MSDKYKDETCEQCGRTNPDVHWKNHGRRWLCDVCDPTSYRGNVVLWEMVHNP